MKDEEIDRILGGEQDLVPSASFHASVMAAVHREAVTLPPIPFPWTRAWPAFAAAALAFVLAGVLLLESVDSLAPTMTGIGAPWIALAALLTAGSLFFSNRLAEERY